MDAAGLRVPDPGCGVSDIIYAERFDTPTWQMMEVRRQRMQYAHVSRVTLCCQAGKHIYAQLDNVDDDRIDDPDERKRVFAELADRAREDHGWLWYIREELGEHSVSDAGVVNLAAYEDICVREDEIGWPMAMATAEVHKSDVFVCQFGLGVQDGATREIEMRQWCGMKQGSARTMLSVQAFVANMRMALAGVIFKNAENAVIKKIIDEMRRRQRRISEDVWRLPVYAAVENLCELRFGGVEVFHADEEFTWTMFLNKRRT